MRIMAICGNVSMAARGHRAWSLVYQLGGYFDSQSEDLVGNGFDFPDEVSALVTGNDLMWKAFQCCYA
jgi:hypothetical protein